MAGIFPDLENGGVIYRGQDGTCLPAAAPAGAYCPDANFGMDCDLRALPDNCSARLSPEQLNSIVSELLAFGEALSPTGVWECGSLNNLSTLFAQWVDGSATTLGGYVTAINHTPTEAAPGLYTLFQTNGDDVTFDISEVYELIAGLEGDLTLDSFGCWNFKSYLHPDDLEAAYAGDTDAQDESRVTAAMRQFWDDVMTWWQGANGRVACVNFPGGITIALNDEMQTEQFADMLWNMGFSHNRNRIYIDWGGMNIRLKNWTARAAARSSGFWAASGVEDLVPKAVFRWEQSAYVAHNPRNTGHLVIWGERNSETDPIGFKVMSGESVIMSGLSVYELQNTGLFVESTFNSSFDSIDIASTGYQVTEYGGTGLIPVTARFSNVANVVTATEPVFDASHVGKQFLLSGAGANRFGYRQGFWAEIISVASPTEAALSQTPELEVTGAYGSFEAIKGSITAGSATLTLSAPITEDLTGRYISVCGCGQQGVSGQAGVLTSRVLTHSGDQVTLSHPARRTVAAAAVVIAPGMFFSRSADAATGPAAISINDDVTFHNLRIENAYRESSVCAILSGTSIDFAPGSKFHGRPMNANNAGTNFADVVYDWASGLRLNSCIITHGGWSPTFGRHCFYGKRINVTITGDEVEFVSTDKTAPIYNDIEVEPVSGRVYYGVTRSGDLVGDQVIARYGTEALVDQIRAANSSVAPKQGAGKAELPTYLDDVTVLGHMRQTERPPTVADLNLVVGAEETVMFNPATLNAPWPNYSGIVRTQTIQNATTQIATSILAGQTVRMAVRHNNAPGNAFTSWRPIYTGMFSRPAAPLLWELVNNPTTNATERWNGTEWVTETGEGVSSPHVYFASLEDFAAETTLSGVEMVTVMGTDGPADFIRRADGTLTAGGATWGPAGPDVYPEHFEMAALSDYEVFSTALEWLKDKPELRLVDRRRGVRSFTSTISIDGNIRWDAGVAEYRVDHNGPFLQGLGTPLAAGDVVPLTADYVVGQRHVSATLPVIPNRGDWLRIVSDAVNPNARSRVGDSNKYRVQEFVQAGDSLGVAGSVALARPLRFIEGTNDDEDEIVMPYSLAHNARICALNQENRFEFTGGLITYPGIGTAGPNAIEARAYYRPRVEGTRFYRLPGSAVVMFGTVEAVVRGIVCEELSDKEGSDAQNGYGVYDGGELTLVENCTFKKCRHGYSALRSSIGPNSPGVFSSGNVVGGRIVNCNSYGTTSTHFDAHHGTVDLSFINCHAEGGSYAYGGRGINHRYINCTAFMTEQGAFGLVEAEGLVGEANRLFGNRYANRFYFQGCHFRALKMNINLRNSRATFRDCRLEGPFLHAIHIENSYVTIQGKVFSALSTLGGAVPIEQGPWNYPMNIVGIPGSAYFGGRADLTVEEGATLTISVSAFGSALPANVMSVGAAATFNLYGTLLVTVPSNTVLFNQDPARFHAHPDVSRLRNTGELGDNFSLGTAAGKVTAYYSDFTPITT